MKSILFFVLSLTFSPEFVELSPFPKSQCTVADNEGLSGF